MSGEPSLGDLVKRALKVLSPGATAPVKTYVIRAGDGSGVVREAEAAWWGAHVGLGGEDGASYVQ